MTTPVNHDGLVTDQAISEVQQRVREGDLDEHIEQLEGLEPKLAGHITEQTLLIAGRLALSQAPHEVVNGVYRDVWSLVLIAIDSLRQSQIDYWAPEQIAGEPAGVPKRYPAASEPSESNSEHENSDSGDDQPPF